MIALLIALQVGTAGSEMTPCMMAGLKLDATMRSQSVEDVVILTNSASGPCHLAAESYRQKAGATRSPPERAAFLKMEKGADLQGDGFAGIALATKHLSHREAVKALATYRRGVSLWKAGALAMIDGAKRTKP